MKMLADCNSKTQFFCDSQCKNKNMLCNTFFNCINGKDEEICSYQNIQTIDCTLKVRNHVDIVRAPM